MLFLHLSIQIRSHQSQTRRWFENGIVVILMIIMMRARKKTKNKKKSKNRTCPTAIWLNYSQLMHEFLKCNRNDEIYFKMR